MYNSLNNCIDHDLVNKAIEEANIFAQRHKEYKVKDVVISDMNWCGYNMTMINIIYSGRMPKNEGWVYAYVVNTTYPACSESGEIRIKNNGDNTYFRIA